MKMSDMFIHLELSVAKANGTLITFFQNLFIGKKKLTNLSTYYRSGYILKLE